MSRRPLGWFAIAGLLAGACSMLPSAAEDRLPKSCIVVYSAARCEAMTDIVAADIGKNRDDVASVAIVPDAPPEGVHLGAGWHIRVRLGLKDGSAHDMLVCGGVLREAACQDDPRLEVRSALSGGYRDVPEGSTPIPAIQDAAAADAEAIALDTLSIPIDGLGEREVALGEGSLANGVWAEGTVEFAEPWPDDLALRDAVVLLEVHSLERDVRPFENAYVHGWRPGVERIRAVLRFDVLWFRPGANLELRNVSVR